MFFNDDLLIRFRDNLKLKNRIILIFLNSPNFVKETVVFLTSAACFGIPLFGALCQKPQFMGGEQN